MLYGGFELSIGGGLAVSGPGPLLRAVDVLGSTEDMVLPHSASLPMPAGVGSSSWVR